MIEIQKIKRDIISIRKIIWPEKDKINDFMRGHHSFVTESHLIYLRDSYDHCVQIIDLVESFKEISYSLTEVYLSTINNKLSEIMKFLTVISSIFIPLSFLAGLYGMNFAYFDENGKKMPLNMPELHHPYGYPMLISFMVVLALTLVLIFKRKGWFK